MCAQIYYTKDLFTLVLFSPMENKPPQFCKSCHKDVLFIAICFWQWFTVHGLRETAQNLLANKVWIFIACDPWTQQIGEALKLGTRYYKHTSPKGQWRLHSLCPKLPHITACPHPLCLTLPHTIPAFKWIPDSFCKEKKENKKLTDRLKMERHGWNANVVKCAFRLFTTKSFSPVDCFKQVSRADSKSLFILGSSLSGIRQRKNYFIWQP